MSALEIATIISMIVASVSVICFYILALKALYIKEKFLIDVGSYDQDLVNSSKKIKKGNTFLDGLISSLIILLCVAVIGTMAYTKFSGELFPYNDSTTLVVASKSMSYTSTTNKNKGYITAEMEAQQFDFGDIIIINDKPVEEDIVLYQIYAYKKDGKTIIHRLYDIKKGDTDTYLFRGDANIGSDDKYVNYEDIIGVYSRILISDIGIVVLFSQSYYGFYILLTIVTILTASSIFERKIYLLLKKRRASKSRSILIGPITENNVVREENLRNASIENTEEIEGSSLERRAKKRFIGKIVWNSKKHKSKEPEPGQYDKE
ncbi:MAG TPA: hypothetical protein PKC96_07555 [Bacilli bacterium]|nr:hypothetical protein [Bacilli bacterium]